MTDFTMDSPQSAPNDVDFPENDAVTKALELFELNQPFSLETLKERHERLLLAWHPHRNANLTNNPTKYMQMYKKGEAKTKEIHAAFQVLKDWLNDNDLPSTN